ncbi:MAG: hypothetical protein SVV03_04795 [Candidatus Nanohaloarchaea archaeon]|nr:hypothetical protein [Candidatus Nanohaloarchaea archaeon]
MFEVESEKVGEREKIKSGSKAYRATYHGKDRDTVIALPPLDPGRAGGWVGSDIILKRLDVRAPRADYCEENLKVYMEDLGELNHVRPESEVNYDMDSLLDAFSAKLLTGDLDINGSNLLVDEQNKIHPIDFEYAGENLEEQYNQIIDNSMAFLNMYNLDLNIEIEDIEERTYELSMQLDIDRIEQEIQENPVVHAYPLLSKKSTKAENFTRNIRLLQDNQLEYSP